MDSYILFEVYTYHSQPLFPISVFILYISFNFSVCSIFFFEYFSIIFFAFSCSSLFDIFLFITSRYFYTASKAMFDKLILIFYNIFGIALALALIYFAVDYHDEVFQTLGGGTSNPSSKIYGEFWLNGETCKVYFNFYTIVALITVTAVISSLCSFFIKDKK